MRALAVVSVIAVSACAGSVQQVARREVAHAVSGSGLLLNMTPAPPQLVGAYDFDLLDQVSGKACVNYHGPMYWVNIPEIEKTGWDEFTRRAVSAAVLDAIGRLEDADTIVLTRVWADAAGANRICATIAGRAVRLKKAAAAAAAEVPGATDGATADP